MDARLPIPNATELGAALDRLGLNRPGVPGRPQVSMKRLRAYLDRGLKGGYRGEESLGRALDDLATFDRFRGEGVRRMLAAAPTLRATVDEGRSVSWHMALDVVVREDPSVVAPVQVDLPPEVAEALGRLPFSDDPARDVARIASMVAGEAGTRADRLAAKARTWAPRLEAALSAAPGREASLAASMRERLASARGVPRHPTPEQVLSRALTSALDHATSLDRERMRNERLRSVIGYADYVEQLKASRTPRRVTFHVGPTNSGKTHDAMAALAAAPTGLYLAPLRLLALEGYERLRDAGVAAGMVTGEETIDDAEATHLSQTIETASLTRTVDVVVVDEVQMLGDRDRGWAWTRALFGARCSTLILCGAPEALPMVLRAAGILGEEVEVVRHDRKAPLTVERRPVRVADVVDGDAVIAFSRKEVHFHRELLIRRGLSVATVYGALSPEVRRAEAARFRSGEATVLVATDAIGMGLNLGPLRRVVFTALKKYDGVSDRPLEPEEIRQIAGRAGRFGHHEAGFVAVMAGPPERIEAALAGKDRAREGDGRFPVRPEPDVMEAAAAEIGTSSLVRLLSEFAKRTVYEGSPFRSSDLDETIDAARAFDDLDLPIREKYAFATCPVDRRSHEARVRLTRFATARANGVTAPLPRSGGRWGHGPGDGLMEHEDEVRMISSYLWLARRFPETFPDEEEATARRAEANRLIEERLSQSATRKARRAVGG